MEGGLDHGADERATGELQATLDTVMLSLLPETIGLGTLVLGLMVAALTVLVLPKFLRLLQSP